MLADITSSPLWMIRAAVSAELARQQARRERDAMTREAARYIYSQLSAHDRATYTRDAWLYDIATATRHLGVIAEDVCDEFEAMLKEERS